jgi:hypothetical protein
MSLPKFETFSYSLISLTALLFWPRVTVRADYALAACYPGAVLGLGGSADFLVGLFVVIKFLNY